MSVTFEAEAAVLGAGLDSPEKLAAILDALEPADFGAPAHREIYGAMLALHRRGEVADTVTTGAELGPKLVRVADQLARLPDCAPVGSLAPFVRIVRDGAQRRRLEAMARQISCQLKDGAELGEVIEHVRQTIEEGHRKAYSMPRLSDLAVKPEELSAARISPRCIVRDYLFADVATLAAPGGTGKTTLLLYEVICIVLRRPVHGLEVAAPGPCLIVSAEDRREQLVARLREIMLAMDLDEEEQAAALGFIWIWDVTGEPLRLVEMKDGNITVAALADNIVMAFQAKPPVLVVFDPVVSFGVSESFVNDNEQAIITACRRIVRGLNCCVRLIAHTGKSNAREATLDQYSSRGGSALSDGARMVSVLQSWQPGHALQPPEECVDLPGSSITILARPKLSYAPAHLPFVWIRRTGWTFESFGDVRMSPEAVAEKLDNKILSFLASEVAAGCRHNKTSLETAIPGMARTLARRTIAQLMARGKIIEADLPPDEQKTRRKTYLVTSAGFGSISENSEINSAVKSEMNNAAAYREKNGGIIPPPFLTPFPDSPAAFRHDSAALAGLEEKTGQEAAEYL